MGLWSRERVREVGEGRQEKEGTQRLEHLGLGDNDELL